MNLDISRLGTPEVIIIALIGVALMLFGYRIKKVAFFLVWFVLGFYLMGLILPNFENIIPENFQAEAYWRLIPLVGGLLLAMLGFSIEKLCVGGVCFALVMLVTTQYFGTDIQTIAAGGIIGVIAAGIAIMAMKPATIVATAVAGAYTVTIAICALVPGVDQGMLYFPSLVGLSVAAILVQYLTTKRMS